MASKSKAKPAKPSWAAEVVADDRPRLCQFPWCSKPLKDQRQRLARMCGACGERVAARAKRVNSGADKHLPAALSRGFQVRTGARVGDE